MHAIRGPWIGQTFALAKSNDYEGRKARIRRSKEERKAMAESFIKRYQESNNGNFPSLNITQKEVGGSFYMVREIVREIIQENRVLGPGKLSSEENSSLDQYPLGSLSIEPQTHLSSSNGAHVINHFTPEHHQDKSKEHILNSSVHFPGHEYQRCEDEKGSEGSSEAVEENGELDGTHVIPNNHQDTSEDQVLNSGSDFSGLEHPVFGDALIVSGSGRAIEENGKYEEPSLYIKPQVTGLDAGMSGGKELETSQTRITPLMADVVVETFPLRPVSMILDGKSEGERVSTVTLDVKEVERVELEAGNGNPVLDRMNLPESIPSSMDKQTEENLAGPSLESHNALVNDEETPNLGDHSVEISSPSATGDSIGLDAHNATTREAKDALCNGVKPITDANVGSNVPSMLVEASSAKQNSYGISEKGSSPTLNRINLESWEGKSMKGGGPQTNSLLVFFKTFVDAFVKFWSE